jgi:alpha-mannosidase
MFHDSITGTHIDAAYKELRDRWQEVDARMAGVQSRAVSMLTAPVDGMVSVLNPFGQRATEVVTAVLDDAPPHPGLVDETGERVPVLAVRYLADGSSAIDFVASDVPPLACRKYQLVGTVVDVNETSSLSRPVIENERFRVEADEHGLRRVEDKRLGLDVLRAGSLRPGELILEHDEGSPWATLHPDQSGEGLAGHTRLRVAERAGAYQRLVFAVNPPRRSGWVSEGLTAELEVRLVAGIDRVEFVTRVCWDTFNHRLRIAFPSPIGGRHMYGIPFGALERPSYEPWVGWAGANGDWPTINWAGVERGGSAADISVAVLSKGLPSYRLDTISEGTVMLLSLLRSPTVPTYLHEPTFYRMTGYDGMRDAGCHVFECAVTAYDGGLLESDVALEAAAYNTELAAVPGRIDVPDMPRVQSRVARLAAIKWAERGRGLILRLVEFRGVGDDVSVVLPGSVTSVQRVNLLEREGDVVPIEDGHVRLTVRPWEIVTLRLGFEEEA